MIFFNLDPALVGREFFRLVLVHHVKGGIEDGFVVLQSLFIVENGVDLFV
jgi:hypothetical protein